MNHRVGLMMIAVIFLLWPWVQLTAQADPCAVHRQLLNSLSETLRRLDRDYVAGNITAADYTRISDQKIADRASVQKQLADCEEKQSRKSSPRTSQPYLQQPSESEVQAETGQELPAFNGTIKNINGKTYILYPEDKMLKDAPKSSDNSALDSIAGSWVIKSGPGIGPVDKNGSFGIKGEKIWYLLTFRPDGTGNYSIHEYNKLSRTGERTTFAWEREMTYTLEGQKVKVVLHPAKLLIGDMGNWVLPNKTMKDTYILNGDTLDMGKGWIARRFCF